MSVREAGKAKGSGATTLARAGFVLVAAWLVTAHSLAAWLAPWSPKTALWLNARQPAALNLLAEQAISANMGAEAIPSDQAPGADETARLEGFARLPKLDLREEKAAAAPDTAAAAVPRTSNEDIEDWLRRGIMAQPLNTQAISLLGMLAIGANDDEKANRFMHAAKATSSRAMLANYWLMRTSFDKGDHAAALSHADTILRHKPQNIAIVAPILGRIAERAPAEMLPVLAAGPPWRTAFFYNLKGHIADARTPLHFLMQLKETSVPPRPEELGAYISLLIENHYWELAYNAWLQFLSPEQLANAGFIYNGGFDFPPAPYVFPFEWGIYSHVGVIADIVPQEGTANNALLLKFGPGRVTYKPVGQTIMLVPGAYSFKGRYKSEIKSRRGFKWQLQCLGKQRRMISASEVINGNSGGWADVTLNFTIPQEDCRAQWLHLALDARSESETIVSGTLLMDDLGISRATGPIDDVSAPSP